MSSFVSSNTNVHPYDLNISRYQVMVYGTHTVHPCPTFPGCNAGFGLKTTNQTPNPFPSLVSL